MPRAVAPLSDAACRRAPPRANARYRLADGRGRYLCIHLSGRKSWQVKYRLKDEATLTRGEYPALPLAEARRGAAGTKSNGHHCVAIILVAKHLHAIPSCPRLESRARAERWAAPPRFAKRSPWLQATTKGNPRAP